MTDDILTFGVKCPHILKLRRSVTGEVMAACGLVTDTVGGTVYRLEEACGICSQKDDGDSPASEAICKRLFDRVARGWTVEKSADGETAEGCGNEYRQDVLTAAQDLASRADPLTVGAAVMTAMIRHGMPLEIGEGIVGEVAPCEYRGAPKEAKASADSCAGSYDLHTFTCALHAADVTLEHCVHCLSTGSGKDDARAKAAVQALIEKHGKANNGTA